MHLPNISPTLVVNVFVEELDGVDGSLVEGQYLKALASIPLLRNSTLPGSRKKALDENVERDEPICPWPGEAPESLKTCRLLQ